MPSDFEDGDVTNRKPGLRLGQGNLAESANPDADGSETGKSIDVNTPVSDLILIECNTIKECDADKNKTYKSDEDSKDINKDGRPTKKRKRDIILLR
jgi:hypothetical protein